MAVRKKRVVKKDWMDFLRKFNGANRFMSCNIFQGDRETAGDITLAGILYDETERVVSVISASDDPERACVSVVDVKVPRGIYLISDTENDRVRGVQIQGGPGVPMVRVEIVNNNAGRNRHIWISTLAQKIYERRGENEGSAQGDWLQAESIVERVVSGLEECLK